MVVDPTNVHQKLAPEQNGNASPEQPGGGKGPSKEQIQTGWSTDEGLQHQQMYTARRVQVKKLQQVLHANRKRGHKIIFGGDSPSQQLSSVMDKQSGKVVSDKADIKRAVHDLFCWPHEVS